MHIWEASALKSHALTPEAERDATCEYCCLLLWLFCCSFCTLGELYGISQPGHYKLVNNTATLPSWGCNMADRLVGKLEEKRTPENILK